MARAIEGGMLAADVIDGVSTIGGGSAPGSALKTRLLALTHRGANARELEERLRSSNPPVIARIQDDRVVLDLRTVDPGQDSVLVEMLAALGRA
jgi:L-seryl-tRNA(Ser) seleniumtransferase